MGEFACSGVLSGSSSTVIKNKKKSQELSVGPGTFELGFRNPKAEKKTKMTQGRECI